jgi:hypothetical protein
MVKCSWMVLCDYVFADANQHPCLIGVLPGTLVTAQLPTAFPDMFFVTSLSGKPREVVKAKLEIAGPSGKQIRQFDLIGSINPTGEVVLWARLRATPLHEIGSHTFTLSLADSVLASTDVHVASGVSDETKPLV